MKKITVLCSLLFILLQSYIGYSQHGSLIPHNLYTHKVVNNGNWSNPDIWEGKRIPGLASIVLIPSGLSVNYDINSDAHIFAISNEGTMTFKPTNRKKIKLVVDTWMNGMMSLLEMDSSSSPNTVTDIVFKAFDIEKKKRNQIGGAHWNNAIKNHFSDGFTVKDHEGKVNIQDGSGVLGRYKWDPTQLSLGLISMGAVDIKGFDIDDFIQLNTNIEKNKTTINFPGIPKGWKVGDRIFIGATNWIRGSETKIIKSISGNTITVDSKSRGHRNISGFNFYPYIGNLTRNITFRSYYTTLLDKNVTRRGHTMFMHNANVKIQHAAFWDLGRTDKSTPLDDFKYTFEDFHNDPKIILPKDSNGNPQYIKADPKDIQNQRGRYAFHFHRTFVNSDKAALAKGNAIWRSPGWGMVHHDGNADFIDNVVFQVAGAGMISESGSEAGLWEHNFVSAGDPRFGSNFTSKDPKFLFRRRRDLIDDDFMGNGAFAMQGRNIRMIDNVANSAGIGFEYQGSGTELSNPVIDLVDTQLIKQSMGIDIFPIRNKVPRSENPIPEFKGNISYMCADGMRSQFRNERAGTSVHSVINDFTVLNSSRFGFYSTSSSGYLFKNSIFHAHKDHKASGKTGILVLSGVDNIIFSSTKFYGWETSIRRGGKENVPGQGNQSANAQHVYHNVTWQASPSDRREMPTNPYKIWGTSNINKVFSENRNRKFKFTEKGDKLDKTLDINTRDFKVTIAGEIEDNVGKRLYGNSTHNNTNHREYNFNNDDTLKAYLRKTASDGDTRNDPVIDNNGNGTGVIIEYFTDRLTGKHNAYYFKFNIRGTSYRPEDANSKTGVTVYTNCNFGGRSATFDEGIYNFGEFTALFPNDQLSSIKVSAGFKATIYQHNLSGKTVELIDDTGCLTSVDFNDLASSLKIEKISNSNRAIIEGLYNIQSNSTHQNIAARIVDNHNAQMINAQKWQDQQWDFKHIGNGVHTIKNIRTNRYLQVDNAGCIKGSNVSTWTNANDDHKKWYITKIGRNHFLHPVHCVEFALDKSGGKGGNLKIWSFNKQNDNQKFSLIPFTRSAELLEIQITLYPNPAKDKLYLDFNAEFGNEGLSYHISTISGKIIYTGILTEGHKNTEIINVENFQNGLYFISIKKSNNQKEIQKKFIIKK
ncbi:T9SS type A sorting domain-containing protein [Aquimarina sp. RZ0]|uniref:T9SS type A sorting domain-containing protein n=1 Tax=Aquimarina sp. RZ0 TaxID=2607730 RepID=UPI0011F30DCC|nr:T9SS type A sorting domain-containing protein [Aquimarina sp. RZ0]KAA1243237.1 T9SS type A sorting domain-containing protein [Aquimarina sp. RZ0]